MLIKCREEVSTFAACPQSESCLLAQFFIVNVGNKFADADDAGGDVGDVGDVLMLSLKTVCVGGRKTLLP